LRKKALIQTIVFLVKTIKGNDTIKTCLLNPIKRGLYD
jgi:hypothetical protein